MHVELMYPSKYLKAADLAGRTVTVTCVSISKEQLQLPGTSKKETKWVMVLSRKNGQPVGKDFVCNKTNLRRIAKVTGQDDSDNWPGKSFQLHEEMVENKGEMVPALRVVLPVVERPRNAGPEPGTAFFEPFGDDDERAEQAVAQ